MKKILLFFPLLFISIFLVGTISALDFDNVASYNKSKQEVTIINAFGLGDTIAIITLLTPVVNPVIDRGDGVLQPVGELRLSSFEKDYSNAFKDMELKDLKTDTIRKDSSFVWKYRIENNLVIDDYKTTCQQEVLTNGSLLDYDCVSSKSGTKNIVEYSYQEFNSISELPIGEAIISVWVDVKPEEHGDFIPTLFGVELDMFAQWTEELSNGLIVYYTFNETSSPLVDRVNGIYNGTDIATVTRSQQGIINNSYLYDDLGRSLLGNITEMNNLPEFTINTWVNYTGGGTPADPIWAKYDGASNALMNLLIRPSGELECQIYVGTSGSSGISTTANIDDGAWHMATCNYNTTDIILYVDGVLNVFGQKTGSIVSDNANITLGGRNQSHATLNFVGALDELGMWNRSLSDSEISDLYNSGAGITFNELNPPVITLNAPQDFFNSSSQIIEFNYTAIDNLNLSNITLFIDGLENLTTINILGNNLTVITTLTLSEGTHNWSVSAENNISESSTGESEVRNLTIDLTNPSVDILFPNGQIDTHVFGNSIDLNYTISDVNLGSCLFEYDGVNTTLNCSEGNSTLTPVVGVQNLIVFANDSSGRFNATTTSWTYGFVEINVTFTENISETTTDTFFLNLTTDIDILSINSILDYNGSEFLSTSSCDGGNCIVSNIIDVLLSQSGESEIHNFFWNISIFNGTDETVIVTSTRSQNVSRIHLQECDAGFVTQTLNFTSSDEQSLARINPYRFDGSFDFWIGGGDVKKSNNFSNASIAEQPLCISPNRTYFIDSQIDYNKVGDVDYTTRNYFFQNDTISNVTQNISLFLLNETQSTTFILKIQDDNLLPLSQHLIFIQRFYPGEDIFRTIQVSKTDDAGQTVGFFETETVDYRFVIKFQGKTLLVTAPQKIVGTSVPFTLTFTIGEDLGAPWADLEPLDDLEQNLTFNKNTNIVTFTYTDTSNNFTLGRLLVQQNNISSLAIIAICNINSTQLSSVLICDVGDILDNSTGSYTATGFITRTSEGELLVSNINFVIENFSDIVGTLGIFLGWFIILISSFAFKFNEIAGIFMINASIIFVNLIGLVQFGILAISAIIAVSIIIVAVLER